MHGWKTICFKYSDPPLSVTYPTSDVLKNSKFYFKKSNHVEGLRISLLIPKQYIIQQRRYQHHLLSLTFFNFFYTLF